jgi:predicted DsbA family dithiol-disulfide isomerase
MMVPLDIFSDPICPWCFIGKSRLDRALAQKRDAGVASPFTITWRPFQLNPTMPREGMDRAAYLEAKFGGKEGARAVYSRIEATAREDGLDIAFDRIARTPNTIDAHRLLRWAALEGAQGPVVDALFDRYFQRGEDISDRALLVAIAREAGMDGDVTERLLAGEADLQEVRDEDAAAREAGLSGVPSFIINGRHLIPGAVDTEVWLKVIDELDDMLASAQPQQS